VKDPTIDGGRRLAGQPASWGELNSKFAKLLSSWWTVAVVLIFAVIQQAVGHQNTDNSWLFTVAEHVLAGARPYVDIIESNPPASFLIYLPAAMIAEALGAPIEAIAVAFVFLSAVLCAWLAWRILLEAGIVRASEAGFVAVAASFALLVLPGFAFAQREHLAVIWCLPVLAVYAARLAGARPDWRKALAAGVLAGFVICIKPHFVLAFALPLSGCMIARRSFRLAFAVENLAAAAVTLSFAAVTFLFFPAYFGTMQVMLDAYVPLKEPLSSLLRQRWLVLNIGLLAITGYIGRGACFTPRAFTFIAASVGFLISYLVQAKGWANHALPAVTLCTLTLALLFAPTVAQAASGETPSAQAAARPIGFLYIILPFFLIAPGVFGASYDWSGEEEHPGLVAAVTRYAPPHPRLIALSPDQSVGHPLVRRVGGVWCGRTNDLMIMIYSRALLGAKRGDGDYRHRLELYASNEASAFLADVQKNRPDAILVDKDQRISEAITHFPDLAAALKDYEPVATVEEIVVWTRRAKG
jgi:hypothetical protein